MFSYLVVVKPFADKLTNWLEMMNYATMMIQVSFFLLFS